MIAGHLNGLQARIKVMLGMNAIFVHCYAYSLLFYSLNQFQAFVNVEVFNKF